ncbi:hypothetical protein HEK616_39360 [Streptomyces nigrescens]|uniref:ATP-grasp-modified RiPP n=1 Tax=Streptomyces nigrescens TaxID=1920 RepID=A0ABM7ZW62_STRNI|nr:hypothetical protein HEK616_39360 [Streptomyces nigrescens]
MAAPRRPTDHRIPQAVVTVRPVARPNRPRSPYGTPATPSDPTSRLQKGNGTHDGTDD